MSCATTPTPRRPYLLAGGGRPTARRRAPRSSWPGAVLALAEAERPLVGGADEGGVIDPDVLWSCTTCGACVEQCPVDIEHVDHIVDMRRYQVLIESSFPAEAGVMLRNLENKGNPWGASPNPGRTGPRASTSRCRASARRDDFEYLFWVGCAGAFDDRAKRTTRAVATLLHQAGSPSPSSARARPAPATRPAASATSSSSRCSPSRTSRRSTRREREEDRRHLPALLQHPGQRVPPARRRLRGRAPHPAAGPPGRDGQAPPVQPVDGGRHLPRPVLPRPAQPGVQRRRASCSARAGADGVTEMPRNSRALVLLRRRRRADVDGGADRQADQRRAVRGGARHRRRTVAVACPFCPTMLTDGVTAAGSGDEVEVVDVATVLLRATTKADSES